MIIKLLDSSPTPRGRAMIDMLYSTGIRVGEQFSLNRSNLDMATLYDVGLPTINGHIKKVHRDI